MEWLARLREGDYFWRSEGVEECILLTCRSSYEHLGDGFEVWNMAGGKGNNSRVVVHVELKLEEDIDVTTQVIH